MGDLVDRRARKKARTREEIRTSAQRLFAERGFDAVTIADVAAAADVAVQTVFNHFSSKEELFFDGRTPWLEGPAAAVRDRAPGVPPMRALRAYTAEILQQYLDEAGTEQRRAVVRTLQASPTLQAYLPAVHQESERRLTEALTAAWLPTAGDDDAAQRDVRMAASLVAALWVSAARTLSQELYAVGDDPAEAAALTSIVERLATRVFDRLESDLATLLRLPEG